MCGYVRVVCVEVSAFRRSTYGASMLLHMHIHRCIYMHIHIHIYTPSKRPTKGASVSLLRVAGCGLRVYGVGSREFGVWGLESTVPGFRLRVSGEGFCV